MKFTWQVRLNQRKHYKKKQCQSSSPRFHSTLFFSSRNILGYKISILSNSRPLSASFPFPHDNPTIRNNSSPSPAHSPPLPSNSLLVTNILHAHGPLRISYPDALLHLSSYPLLTYFILTHNNFSFNSLHYLQVKGTAMGIRMAPFYANLFIGSLDEDFLNSEDSKPDLISHNI